MVNHTGCAFHFKRPVEGKSDEPARCQTEKHHYPASPSKSHKTMLNVTKPVSCLFWPTTCFFLKKALFSQ